MLQGTYRRYYNDRRRFQLCHPALDIQEFLRTQVSAEASLCDRVITQL